jgi:uncharacterized protein
MILLDANLLLYAYDSSSRRHAEAKAWLEARFAEPEPIGLALVSVLAFVRITTNRRLHANPLGPVEALRIAAEWLARPNVALLQPTERHWPILERLLDTAQASGPLVMDAHLAALAVEHGARLYSTDSDFTRFADLAWENPLGAR